MEKILGPIWAKRKEYEGEEEYEGGPFGPFKYHMLFRAILNALLERLDLLLASQKAGHTGVRNELVSICDELKRQGVLNSMSYKNLISIIKK